MTILFKLLTHKDNNRFIILISGLLILKILTLFIPTPPYAILYSHLALQEKNKGNLNKAIQMYHQAIFHDPFYPAPYFHLGEIYEILNDHEEKFKYFKKAAGLGANPAYYAKTYFEVGLSHFDKEEYRLAKRYFQLAAQRDCCLYEAYYYAGLVDDKLGDIDGISLQMYYIGRKVGSLGSSHRPDFMELKIKAQKYIDKLAEVLRQRGHSPRDIYDAPYKF